MAEAMMSEREFRERETRAGKMRDELAERAARAEQQERENFTDHVTAIVTRGLSDQSEDMRVRVRGLVARGIEDPAALRGYRVVVGGEGGQLRTPRDESAGEGAEVFPLDGIVASHVSSREHARAAVTAREELTAIRTQADEDQRELSRAELERVGALQEQLARPVSSQKVTREEIAHVMPDVLAPFASEHPELGLSDETVAELQRLVREGSELQWQTTRLVRIPSPSPLSESERARIARSTGRPVPDTVMVHRAARWQPGEARVTPETHGAGADEISLDALVRGIGTHAAQLRRRFGVLWRDSLAIYGGSVGGPMFRGMFDGSADRPAPKLDLDAAPKPAKKQRRGA